MEETFEKRFPTVDQAKCSRKENQKLKLIYQKYNGKVLAPVVL